MAAMSDRVADCSDTRTGGPFALGAAVLHTTAESLEVSQPHTNEDASLVLVIDGYLTNWEELRRDLTARGARLRNASDAELVLRAYEQWGEDCASRLEGEFAFVIADQRARRLYAARDHQGLRPLFWYQDRNALLIASDLAAIIKGAERPPEPNLEYCATIVSGEWHLRDATVWQGVERVPQAHWLTSDGVTVRRQQYYQLPVHRRLRYPREEDYVDHYREVLIDAVRRTARSHRTLGVAVSGGLDSSALYCIAHRLEQAGKLPAPGLLGVTLAGEEGTNAYELPYVRAAAAHCGREVIEAPLFRPDIGWFIDRSIRDCDIPIPQNGAMSRNLEAAAVAGGARILMHGDGGDQWLDGNVHYYREFMREGQVAGFCAALQRDAAVIGWRAILPLALRTAIGGFAPDFARRIMRRRRLERRYANPDLLFWMQPAWRARLQQLEWDYEMSLPADPEAWRGWARLFSPYRSYALDVVQRQHAQSGLETRAPMQSRAFIEFCVTTPEWIRNQGQLTKVVHRKAMRSIMPDIITDRETKAEFGTPALTTQFAVYTQGEGAASLRSLCHSDGMGRLTGFDNRLSIDPERSWEVWGCYAVAAFLTASGLTSVLDRQGIGDFL